VGGRSQYEQLANMSVSHIHIGHGKTHSWRNLQVKSVILGTTGWQNGTYRRPSTASKSHLEAPCYASVAIFVPHGRIVVLTEASISSEGRYIWVARHISGA
jgi:hypothetical protein